MNTEPTNAELQPCPFGCKEDLMFYAARDVRDGFDHGFTIQCPGCGIEMHDEYREQVVETWNARLRSEPPVDEQGVGGTLEASLARIGRSIDSGKTAGAITAEVGGKRYIVIEFAQYEHDLLNRQERGRKAALAAMPEATTTVRARALEERKEIAAKLDAALLVGANTRGFGDDMEVWSNLVNAAKEAIRALGKEPS